MPRDKRTFNGLSMTQIFEAALIGLGRQRSEIEEKIAELRRQIGARPVRRPGRPVRKTAGVDSGAPAVKKRTRSAAVRRRMADAQRKRWAKIKKAQTAEAKPVKKRKLSAAGRKRIIAATKKRWAEFHAKKAAAK